MDDCVIYKKGGIYIPYGRSESRTIWKEELNNRDIVHIRFRIFMLCIRNVCPRWSFAVAPVTEERTLLFLLLLYKQNATSACSFVTQRREETLLLRSESGIQNYSARTGVHFHPRSSQQISLRPLLRTYCCSFISLATSALFVEHQTWLQTLLKSDMNIVYYYRNVFNDRFAEIYFRISNDSMYL